ncbi:MAG TPA: hypothetical protein VGB30_12130 [bacterium]|jgi:hypothetical protein
MNPLKSAKKNPSFDTELSPSIIYRELERFHIDTIYDPLASTTGCGGYFKLQNTRIIANDWSFYTYVKGKALWENNHFTIPQGLADYLAKEHKKLPEPDHYKDLGSLWLTDEHRKWLELWRRLINEETDEYIRTLAETAVCLVIEYWFTEKRFGAVSDWAPHTLLGYYIRHVNNNLLDNEESNEMWREDPVELTEKVIADIMFFNPPPIKGYDAFGPREKVLESWLRGVSDFELGKIAPENSVGSSFMKVSDYLDSLRNLLEAADHIPMWAIALGNRQPFTRLEIGELLSSLGRSVRDVDLMLTRKFFSLRAPDTILIVGR